MIPEILLELIKKYEGCRLHAYLCPAGVWTIGYGATGRGISNGVIWTQEQADARLYDDALRFYMEAGRLSPILWLDGDKKHSAIADFCFNLGATRYKASTLKRKVDAGDWVGAQHEIQKWVWGGGKKLPGLVARRREEAALLS